MIRIQPVSKDHFKTPKVSLRDIAIKRRAGRAVLAERHNPDGSVTQVFLIPEGSSTRVREGQLVEAQHLRTRRPYGDHLILSVFDFKFKRGLLYIGDFEPGTADYSYALDVEAVAFEMA
jgi:hypothetical protein